MADAKLTKARLQVTLSPTVVTAAKHLAKLERRSVSNLIECLIERANFANPSMSIQQPSSAELEAAAAAEGEPHGI